MSDLVGAGDGDRTPPPPNTNACKHCGGVTAQMAMLDSRQGKTFRLFRCITCEKMGWAEEVPG